MPNSHTQIVATIGPASFKEEVMKSMIEKGMDVARLNFSWGELSEKKVTIDLIKKVAALQHATIKIIADIPGPRVQEAHHHSLDHTKETCITEADKKYIEFAVAQNLDYIALSFVASQADVREAQNLVRSYSGSQKIIAKIERREAVDNLEEIIDATDAVMVARGDLGNDVPIEEIPFIQEKIVKLAKSKGKPVIVATQMLFSMTNNELPTRAEVTDVEAAVMEGADAVMLSEETAMGTYPIEAVTIMERIIVEAEKHLDGSALFNNL